MSATSQLSLTTNMDVEPASRYQSDRDDKPWRPLERSATSTSRSNHDLTTGKGTIIDLPQTPSVSPTLLRRQSSRNMEDYSTINPVPYTAIVNESNTDNFTGQSRSNGRFWKWFKRTHFKNWKNTCIDLILFRSLSVLGLIIYTIIDTIMYSISDVNKSPGLQFMHGSRYIALEVFTIVYVSGLAAFGVSVEIYVLIPYIISTCILSAHNCGGPIVLTSIFWIFKILFMVISVEVIHHNFRKFRKYEENFKSSSRALLRQALIFSVTMLFLSAPGLKSLYNAINSKSALFCPYDTSHCGIVELYAPQFTYDNDRCLGDIRDYVTGREQLRVLRNFMLLNGVSYAIFNRNFLDIEHHTKYFIVRVFLILLYIVLATSVIVSYVDTLYFIEKCRLPYNIIELIIFFILFVLPAVNLYQIRRRQGRRQSQVSVTTVGSDGKVIPQENEVLDKEDMDPKPKVLP